MNGSKLFQWTVGLLLSLLSFLGVGLWNDQRSLTVAIGTNSAAVLVLAEKFSGFELLADERTNQAARDRMEILDAQRRIVERLERSGMGK